MSNHNSRTSRPIWPKLWLGNSVELWDCYRLGLTILSLVRNLYPESLDFLPMLGSQASLQYCLTNSEKLKTTCIISQSQSEFNKSINPSLLTSNQIKSNQIKSNQTKSNKIKSNKIFRNVLCPHLRLKMTKNLPIWGWISVVASIWSGGRWRSPTSDPSLRPRARGIISASWRGAGTEGMISEN